MKTIHHLGSVYIQSKTRLVTIWMLPEEPYCYQSISIRTKMDPRLVSYSIQVNWCKIQHVTIGSSLDRRAFFPMSAGWRRLHTLSQRASAPLCIAVVDRCSHHIYCNASRPLQYNLWSWVSFVLWTETLTWQGPVSSVVCTVPRMKFLRSFCVKVSESVVRCVALSFEQHVRRQT